MSRGQRDPHSRPEGFRTKLARFFQEGSRRNGFVWFAFGAIVLLGIVTYIVTQQPPPIKLFVFTVSDYDEPLPPNGWAHEDGQTLRRTLTVSNQQDGQSKRQFLADLERYVESYSTMDESSFIAKLGGAPSDLPILVYVSATGLVDGQGRPCLLFSDAKAYAAKLEDNAESTWLPMEDVLETLSRVKPGTKKVLFLDANRVQHDWSIGVTSNPFTLALQDLMTKGDYKFVTIFNSVSHGQIGYTAPELGGSVFACFLASGLSGRADLNSDGTLLAGELRQYLEVRVRDWVRDHRGAEQTPTVFDVTGSQFKICKANTWPDLKLGDPQVHLSMMSDRKSDVDKLWSDFEKLANDTDRRKLLVTSPIQYGRFLHAMERVERLWASGGYYLTPPQTGSSAFESAVSAARGILVDLDKHSRRSPRLPAIGLTVSNLKKPTDYATFRPQLDAFLKRTSAGSEEAEPEDAETAEPDADEGESSSAEDGGAGGGAPMKNPKPKNAAPQPPPTFAEAISVVWEHSLASSSLPKDTLGQLVEYLETRGVDKAAKPKVEITPAFPVKEAFLLRLLGEANWSNAEMPRLVNLVLQRFDETEQASRPVDFRALPWLAPQLRQLDNRFRLDVFDRVFGPVEENAVALTNAANNGGLAAALAKLKSDSDDLSTGFHDLDELRAEYPWVAQFALRNPQSAIGELEWFHFPDQASEKETGQDGDALQAAHYQQLRQVLLAAAPSYSTDTKDSSDDEANTDNSDADVFQSDFTLPGNEFRIYARGWTKRHSGQTRENIRDALEILRTPIGFQQLNGGEAASSTSRATLRDKLLTQLEKRKGMPKFKERVKAIPPEPDAPERIARDRAEAARREQAESQTGAPHLLNYFSLRQQRLDTRKANATQWISQVSSEMRKQLQQDSEAFVTPGNGDLDRLADRARIMVGLAALPYEFIGTEIIDAQNARNRKRYVSLQADRVLADFWGNLGRSQPFFQEVLSLPEFEAFETRVSKLASAAFQWEPLQGTKGFVSEGETTAPIKFRWQNIINTARSENNKSATVPDGRAVVRLGDARHLRGTSGVINRADNREVLEIDTTAKARAVVTAKAFFRGHLRSATSTSEVSTATQIATWKPNGPARIRVGRLPVRNIDLVLALDCSASMNTKDRIVEGGKGFSRFEVAKKALANLLNKLRQENPRERYRVGFVFFGHRAGWRNDTVRAGDPTINPWDDVQPFPLGPIDEQVLDNARQPIGETPLYLAIENGLDVLSASNAEGRNSSSSEKYLVVLTDGVNDVSPEYEGISFGGLKEKLTGPTFSRYALTVCRVGNRPLKRQAQFDAGLKELEELSALPNANVRVLTNIGQLETTVINEVAKGAYTVEVNGQQQNEILNRDIEIEDEQVNVVLRRGDGKESQAEVALEGGERLAFEIDPEDDDKLSIMDEPAIAANFEPVPPSVKQSSYSLSTRFFRKPTNNRVTLDIDIAFGRKGNPSGHTNRPKNVWAVVTPENDPTKRFFFFDRTFVEGMSVPVLRLSVSHWPPTANTAIVKLRVSEGPQRSQDRPSGVERMLATPTHLRLKEEFEGKFESWSPLALQPDSHPNEIVRRFYAEERKAVHDFTFQSGQSTVGDFAVVRPPAETDPITIRIPLR